MSQPGLAGEQIDAGVQDLRPDERHVALQIDDHVVGAVRIELRQGGQDAVRARRQARIGQHRPAAGRRHRPTISGSPAATATGPAPARSAQRRTRTIMGAPSISARGLPGSRVAAMRAGIITIGFIRPKSSERRQTRTSLQRIRASWPLNGLQVRTAGCASGGSVSQSPAQA